MEENRLTFVDVALDHHAHDACLPGLDLLRKNGRHLWLVLVVFEGVAVQRTKRLAGFASWMRCPLVYG